MIREVYMVVAARTKAQRLRTGEIRVISSIDPYTHTYEKDRGVMNCFDSLALGKSIWKKAQDSSGKSVLGLYVDDSQLVMIGDAEGLRNISRMKKSEAAEWCAETYGTPNYVVPFQVGERRYCHLIISDCSCITGLFDPLIQSKKAVDNSCIPKEIQKERLELPRPSVVRPVATVTRQTDGFSWDTLAFFIGVLIGFVSGIAFGKFIMEHPYIIVVLMIPVVTLLVLTLIWFLTEKAEKK